jgi:hypothetical protein
VAGEGRIAQRFAIDWVRLFEDGRTFRGDPRNNASYRALASRCWPLRTEGSSTRWMDFLRVCLTPWQSAATPRETATTHNARHQARPEFSTSLHECAQSSWSVIAKSGDFPVDFDDGGGLKNRRLHAKENAFAQVPVSRTLTRIGEVAERLKAAVC